MAFLTQPRSSEYHCIWGKKRICHRGYIPDAILAVEMEMVVEVRCRYVDEGSGGGKVGYTGTRAGIFLPIFCR